MDNAIMQAHVDAVRQHKASIETSFAALSGHINDLRTRVSMQTSATDALAIRISALESGVIGLGGSIQNFTQAIDSLCSTVNAMLAKIEAP